MVEKADQLNFEHRLFWLCLSAATPVSMVLLWLLWWHQYSHYLIALVLVFLFLQIGITAYQVKAHISNQFRTLTNLMEALTNGDYSLRGRRHSQSGALSELVLQINGLADLLAKQRFEVRETQLLLSKVIAQINVGVFTFDQRNTLALINPAGARLLGRKDSDVLGTSAKALGLEQLLQHQEQVMNLELPGGKGRFHVATDTFIEDGSPHALLFITNVQDMLRAEERKAWQNLIRVISHEINNSLTPIASISQSLIDLPSIDKTSQQESLSLIRERASSLQEFVNSYRRLTKLPTPQPQIVDLSDLMTQVTTMFPEVTMRITGEPVQVLIDLGQWQQMMLNLVKNAAEAVRPDPLHLDIRWLQRDSSVEITIADNGPGIANTDNLFVPFYTTKEKGSGIGLLLCRNIVEAHGGEISLANGANGGCIVTLRLPIKP